jgi:hypothetical protein
MSADAPLGTRPPYTTSRKGDAQSLSEDVLLAAGLITPDDPLRWPGWANVVFFAVPEGAEANALRTVLAFGSPEEVLAAYALGDRDAVVGLLTGWAAQGTP